MRIVTLKKKRKILVTIVFMILLVSVNKLLSFALVPPGLTRVILHETETYDFKCVVLGTSHGSYGIDANIVSEVSGVRTMNLCIGGEYMQDSYYLLKQVFETNTPELIVLDVDFQYLVNVPKESISANFIYNAYPTTLNKLSYFKDKIMRMEYRAALFPWLDYRNNYSSMAQIVSVKFGEEYKNFNANAVKMEAVDTYMGNGFIYRNTSSINKTDTLGAFVWEPDAVDDESIDYLKKIISLCNEKAVRIVMTTLPISVETIENSFEEYDKAYGYVSDLAATYGVEYYNFNNVKDTVFERNSDDYWDYDGHMYGSAAQRFSKVFGCFIKDIKNNDINSENYLYNSLAKDLDKE